MGDPNTAAAEVEKQSLNALQDNIRKKGKNSYYFAHEKSRETEFNYGGDPQPVSKDKAVVESASSKRKHRIPKYSWADGNKTVKLYIPTEFCGEEGLPAESINIDWTDTSVTLSVGNVDGGKDYELCFPKLHDEIRKVTHKQKPDSLVVTLWKVTEISWYKLGEK
eukprot:CAMPEP_0184541014 /NCGR_PEP_ID=MMETSP0199_2-20130426/1100_1 /TAXON_ID=1112570 /ORGANISM="Thraustochytrium sp., Strain LLF1b" /LENGTH=164 /DNA_ID=CAMNT_0026934701 /DNA_START=270 /DNA_END=764 /DNA_ORIENTATION=-